MNQTSTVSTNASSNFLLTMKEDKENRRKDLILIGGLSFRSFFEGLAIGILSHQSDIIGLMVGIALHKWAETITIVRRY